MSIAGELLGGAAGGLASGLVGGALAARIMIRRNNSFSARQESSGHNSPNVAAGESVHWDERRGTQ
jgi:hypothetical protein